MRNFISLISVCAFLISCTADKYEPAPKCISTTSYGDVRQIISTSCNGSGCHDGSSGVGDYRSYSGLDADIKEGKFFEVLFVTGSMPPDGFEISQEDLQLLKCWADNNYAVEQ